MSEFVKANIKNDPMADAPKRIVKMDFSAAPEAKPYELRPLKADAQGTYESTKSRFGALAYTDPDRRPATGRDGAFEINPLLREPLGIEAEERRVIEERVQARLKEIMETEVARAREQGFEAGRKEGFEAAHAEFREEGAARLERLDAMIAQAEAAKGEILRANERFVMSVIYRVARMVMLKELSADKEYILRLTRELIERVGVPDNIRIRVNPGELETMTTVREGLEKHFGAIKNLQIDASNEVSEGGCILETEWNAIDATIDTQLRAIETALLGQASSAAPEPAGETEEGPK